MNLRAALMRLIRRDAPAPSTLRNKPDGMAFIRISNVKDGSDAMDGRIVQTKRVNAGFWLIEPPQTFVARDYCVADDGRVGTPGTIVTCTEIHDDLLEPLKDTGLSEEEVRDLYSPTSPVREGQTA